MVINIKHQNKYSYTDFFSPHGALAPGGPEPPYYRGFTITLRHTTFRFLWASDQPDAETSITTPTTNIHAPGGIRTHNPSKQAAADPALRPRGHWGRLMYRLKKKFPSQYFDILLSYKFHCISMQN